MNPDELPAHESAVRRMVSDANGEAYVAVRSLDDAKALPDGVVVLEGDWGGQVYVVAPARLVRCSAATLEQLLRDLDDIAWPVNGGEGAGVYYERRAVGGYIAGGMRGGRVIDGIWIHDEFEQLGLGSSIREIVTEPPNGCQSGGGQNRSFDAVNSLQ